MRPTHLLDTSVYSQPLRRTPLESVRRRWEAIGDDRLCISIITEAEVLLGLELRDSGRLWRMYRAILRGRLPTLNVDAAVGEAYAAAMANLTRRGLKKSAFDVLIAATARAHGLAVATCNARDYLPIEGLAVEDWSR